MSSPCRRYPQRGRGRYEGGAGFDGQQQGSFGRDDGNGSGRDGGYREVGGVEVSSASDGKEL